jgi:hypothetical protein
VVGHARREVCTRFAVRRGSRASGVRLARCRRLMPAAKACDPTCLKRNSAAHAQPRRSTRACRDSKPRPGAHTDRPCWRGAERPSNTSKLARSEGFQQLKHVGQATRRRCSKSTGPHDADGEAGPRQLRWKTGESKRGWPPRSCVPHRGKARTLWRAARRTPAPLSPIGSAGRRLRQQARWQQQTPVPAAGGTGRRLQVRWSPCRGDHLCEWKRHCVANDGVFSSARCCGGGAGVAAD